MYRTMTKILVFLTLLLTLAAACSKNNNESKEKDGNKQNETDSRYKRIVVLDPAVVEMIYLLESEDRIVGVANLERSKIWHEEKVSKIESVGTFMKPSLEKIISLKPDLVFASFHTTEELDSGMRANNIEIKRYRANTIEEIFKNFQEIAKILGKEKEADKIISEKRAKIEEIKKMETSERKGMFVLSSSPLMVFGKDTLPNDIMKLLNIKNIAETLDGSNPIISAEYIIKEQPEIILTMIKDPDEIVTANPQLKNVEAIKNHNFIIVDSSQILRGSPRTIDHIIDVYQKTEK